MILARLAKTILICFCGFLISGILVVPASGSSVNVPLDHWSYRAIDSLIGFGLIQTAMLGTRPFSRDEMARLIVEAIPQREQLPYHERKEADRLLKRLLRVFQDEVHARTGHQDKAPATFIKPIAEISTQTVHLDGEPIRMLPEDRIDATEGTPLLRNNEGITYRDGSNFMLTANAYGKLWDHFSFFVQPLFLLRPDDGDSVDADIRLHKGYLKASLGPFELELGRDAIWWGQGYRGTLIFSNHARPLDMVQLSTPHPVRLPWIFRHLGSLKTAMFFSILEEDRDVPRTKLAGGRLQLKPLWWLELGVVAAVQFDGEGVPGLGLQDLPDILFFRNPSDESGNLTNQLMAFDMRITLPFLRYSQFYAEYGGEDSAGGQEIIVGDQAFLFGLYVPRLTRDGRTTLRFEWMQNDFANDANTPSVWYTHRTWTSGFTFKGRVLGHAAGGDGAEIFWRMTRDLREGMTLGVDFSYQWRGDVLLRIEPGNEKERHYRGGIDFQHFITKHLEVRTRIAMEAVENFNHLPGDDRTNWIFLGSLRYHFL